MITIHWAKARKPGFLREEAKIAGPFETGAEARAAADRLRPFYPGCEVWAMFENVSNAKGPGILGGPRITERTTVLELEGNGDA